MTIWMPYIALCRTYICFFAACSTVTGYFLFSYHRMTGAFAVATAVFILSGGASALNQYQERHIDARMERTRNRPLPSGSITPTQALSFASLLIFSGLLLLWLSGGITVLILGFAAILYYNGFYTYLKRATAYASFPGAVVGMIPPAIGWIAADGSIVDARIAVLCFIFFMWQVPHFWLLVLNHGNEYEQAGLPSLTTVMSKAQIGRITFVWIVAAAIATLALPLYGSVRSTFVTLSIIPLAAWLIWNERSLTGRQPFLPPSPVLFRKINIYLFLIMSLLSSDNFFLT